MLGLAAWHDGGRGLGNVIRTEEGIQRLRVWGSLGVPLPNPKKSGLVLALRASPCGFAFPRRSWAYRRDLQDGFEDCRRESSGKSRREAR